MGRKLIAAMYFPLLNDGVRFIWSLLQAIILIVIMVLPFQVVFDEGTVYHNCSHPGINYTCIAVSDTAEALSRPMGVFATVIAVIDCIACTSYFLNRKCYKRPQTATEEQPLLGARVSSVRWSAGANWWHKYSDIPRFKVFEALYTSVKTFSLKC